MRTRPRKPWLIRHDLFWGEVFARLAGPERPDAPRTELHADLARLYLELADAYRHRRDWPRADRAQRRADDHAYLGTPPDPELPRADSAVLPLEAGLYQRTNAKAKISPR